MLLTDARARNQAPEAEPPASSARARVGDHRDRVALSFTFFSLPPFFLLPSSLASLSSMHPLSPVSLQENAMAAPELRLRRRCPDPVPASRIRPISTSSVVPAAAAA